MRGCVGSKASLDIVEKRKILHCKEDIVRLSTELYN
jgi:hypothetical protein